MNFLFLLIIYSSIEFTLINSECGYEGCYKTNAQKLNIHLIAHSHDDVGWISSVDNYYTDSVREIITNVVKCLSVNSSRRFTQVEIYFFQRWWREQNRTTQEAVRQLVKNGQFVFTNGGWTVNDEGTAHYNNIIDQMTLGMILLI